MASKGLKYRTIKSYMMAGIRHLHIEEGLADHCCARSSLSGKDMPNYSASSAADSMGECRMVRKVSE